MQYMYVLILLSRLSFLLCKPLTMQTIDSTHILPLGVFPLSSIFYPFLVTCVFPQKSCLTCVLFHSLCFCFPFLLGTACCRIELVKKDPLFFLLPTPTRQRTGVWRRKKPIQHKRRRRRGESEASGRDGGGSTHYTRVLTTK